MPYREKVAWLSLLAMVVAFGPYFVAAATASHPPQAMPDLHQLGLFALTVIVQVFILAVGHLLLRKASPDDAHTPPDERDRAIMRRAMTLAYYVLIAGMIQVGCVMPFYAGGWAIVNAALFMIIAAEVVHYTMVVVSYRRQT
jgi:hypothetical protein